MTLSSFKFFSEYTEMSSYLFLISKLSLSSVPFNMLPFYPFNVPKLLFFSEYSFKFILYSVLSMSVSFYNYPLFSWWTIFPNLLLLVISAKGRWFISISGRSLYFYKTELEIELRVRQFFNNVGIFLKLTFFDKALYILLALSFKII